MAVFLFVGATGAKLWHFIYTFDGKRRKIAFGAYPDTTLENARCKAEEARDQIASSVDPGEIRKQAKAATQLAKVDEERIRAGLAIFNRFADIPRQWLASIAHLTSDKTHTKKTSRIERLAFPLLGDYRQIPAPLPDSMTDKTAPPFFYQQSTYGGT